MSAPTSVLGIADPVERARAYLDYIDGRFNAVAGAAQQQVTEKPGDVAQFGADAAAWKGYYSVTRPNIPAHHAATVWSDAQQWDGIVSAHAALFGVAGITGTPQPPKDAGTAEASAKPVLSRESVYGLLALVSIGAALAWLFATEG